MISQQKTGLTLLILSAVGIAVATLSPGGGGSATALCIFCGERGSADFLSNVVLFTPLGLAIALLTGSVLKAIAAGVLFSCGIEAAQVAMVYGRDANVGDVVANGLGAALGWRLGAGWRSWLDPDASGRKLAGWTAAVLGSLLLGLSLFTPSMPQGPYYLQWTARFGNMHPYEGRVLSSRVGALDLSGPPWRIAAMDSVRKLLETGAPIEIVTIAGPPPAGPAPIVSIGDPSGREVLFIGADGLDLVQRYRMRADRVRLDRGELRIAGALDGVVPGSELRIRLDVRRDGFCIDAASYHHCGSGFTVGDTWALLMYPNWNREVRYAMQMFWLFCLFIPSGFLAVSTRRALLIGAAVAVALLAGPYTIRFAPTPTYQILAALSGVAAGFVLRVVVLRIAQRNSRHVGMAQTSEIMVA